MKRMKEEGAKHRIKEYKHKRSKIKKKKQGTHIIRKKTDIKKDQIEELAKITA